MKIREIGNAIFFPEKWILLPSFISSSDGHSNLLLKEDKLFFTGDNTEPPKGSGKNLHLYIISDENISENDCIINSDHEGYGARDYKIIATNNPELVYDKNQRTERGKFDNLSFEEGMFKANFKPTGIPFISVESLHQFAINYNNKNFGEVLVEYENYLTDGWMPTYNNPDNHNLEEPAELDFRVKISSENTISFIFEEVERDLFEELIQTIENNAVDNQSTITNVKLWAKSWRKERENN